MSIISASHWQEIDADEWPAEYFTPKECADSQDGSIVVYVPALVALDEVRRTLNKPIKVNSWYRTPEHDKAIGGAGGHPEGRCIDIAISHGPALMLMMLASRVGFTGIGVKQNGPVAGRFIHLDMLEATPARPRPTIWSY